MIHKKRGITIKRIPAEILGKALVPILSINEQNKLPLFSQKSEESKSVIQASLDSLTQVYKKTS